MDFLITVVAFQRATAHWFHWVFRTSRFYICSSHAQRITFSSIKFGCCWGLIYYLWAWIIVVKSLWLLCFHLESRNISPIIFIIIIFLFSTFHLLNSLHCFFIFWRACCRCLIYTPLIIHILLGWIRLHFWLIVEFRFFILING